MSEANLETIGNEATQGSTNTEETTQGMEVSQKSF